MNSNAIDLKIEQDSSAQSLSFLLVGELNIDAVANLWKQCMSKLDAVKPNSLIVNAEGLSYCDSAGISFLLELKKYQRSQNKQFELTGLAEQFVKLFDIVEKIPEHPLEREKPFSPKSLSITGIGKLTCDVAALTKENTLYLGELCSESFRCLLKPSLVRWKTVLQVIEAVGPKCLPIVLLLGFLIGLIMSFQSAIPLETFGAVIYVANIIGISMTRELGPLLVAIILAGRTASSFAAELGTMKVNQELDALKTMGLKPLLYLVVPRVLAVMLMSPVLTIFMIAIAFVGSDVFLMMVGYSWQSFFTQVHAAVSFSDLFTGLFKSVVFGVLVAGIGCMHGLRTRFGASAVGVSTTRAVVSCIVMIVVLDSIFSVLFYVMGI
jgi:phospholipid/cholesterol/gamma-HCH transport system permease protein